MSKAQDAALEAQSQLMESSSIIEGLRARIEEERGRVEKKSFIDAAECKVLPTLVMPSVPLYPPLNAITPPKNSF